MNDAAEELRSKFHASEYEITDTAVSCDDSWQKRGCSSLNGGNDCYFNEQWKSS